MATTHNLGFPRIGKYRELKFALEKYWSNAISQDELLQTASVLRKQHWQNQNKLDWVPVGDFSFYDQVLDMSFLLGNVPERAKILSGNALDNYFRAPPKTQTTKFTIFNNKNPIKNPIIKAFKIK